MRARAFLRRAARPGLGLLLATLALALAAAPDARAADYRFSVPRMQLDAWIRPDGSAQLVYVIDFACAPGAHPIDIVDVGMPNDGYVLSSMEASVNGEGTGGGIKKSTYISTGVEVPLGSLEIQPGRQGQFAFRGVVTDMVWQDTTDKNKASFQLVATWFDPSLVTGATDLSINVHVPPGVALDEVVWQSDRMPFTRKVVGGQPEHVIASWDFPGLRLGPGNPKVGLSFPKRVVERVRSISWYGLFIKWMKENPKVRAVSFLFLVFLMGYIWYRLTAGTGCAVFLILAGIFSVMLLVNPGLHLVAWPALVTGAVLATRAAKRRKREYVPAKASVEGGGIKRGLTAPEAAVVLGLPLDRVLSLVMVGLLKKELVTETSERPLGLRTRPELGEGRAVRLAAAAGLGRVVHDWEHAFLDRLTAAKPVRELDFSEPLEGLIQHVTKRLQGFDLDATREYYKSIVARAWREAEGVHSQASFKNQVGRDLEWLMLDDDWNSRFSRRERSGYVYVPAWHHGPVARGPIGMGGPVGAGGPGPSLPAPGGHTTGGEVASSFTGWAENASSNLLGAFSPSKIAAVPGRPLVDFGDFDKALGKALAEMAKNSGSGGGGGGGCACACAGCACACACAGGGR